MLRSIQFLVLSLLASLYALTASAQEAYVYVSAKNLTYVYDAATSGKLTPIKGTPFQTKGTLIGTNGKFFLTYDGSTTLRAYKITSDAGIGAQTSEINPQTYISNCAASPNSAELDHTGSYIYVEAGGDICTNVETFKVSSSGELTFQGVTDIIGSFLGAPPKVLGNEKYAFALSWGIDSCCAFTGFSRESATGVVNQIGMAETDPAPGPGGTLVPWGAGPSPDPTNHLAVTVSPAANAGTEQLASYTVDSHGDVISTNTWKDMPTIPDGYNANDLKLDPTGKYLAVAYRTGIRLYHFDGAKPITAFSQGLVGVSGSISQVAWDKSGHLYGLNSSGKMHVYSVSSSKGLEETSGSRTGVPLGPFVVRSK